MSGLNQEYLKKKAFLIYSQSPSNLDDISIIIPNKRAAIYLQKCFAEIISKPFFAPEIITINEWIDRNTSRRIIQQSELLFSVYEIHKKLNSKSPEDFNEFLKWGKIMLSDFDEIDRYLIPPKLIFSDLRNIKEIENWSFNEENLSNGQEKFIKIWDQLPDYYSQLNSTLDARGETYQGKAYQLFADNIESFSKTKNHFYFLGFNALSASEEKIISTLVRLKKATFFSDIDSFYFNNEKHEAGHFYRKLCEKWQIKPEVESDFNSSPKKIEIIETAQQIGQAKIAGNIIKQFIDEKVDLGSVAIVLADESLLIPLTRSLPNDLETANITMGYPIKFSHLKSLIDLVFDLQFNFQKFSSSRLYHKTILRILDHTYISVLINKKSKITELEKLITENNRVFIEWEELIDYLPELSNLNGVFSLWKNPAEEGFKAMNKIVATIYDAFKSANNAIDLEILYHFSKSFKKFETIWKIYPYEMNLKSFKRLFYQFWQSDSLSFLGNPIDGIQIMGILETRTIDFENLIILGMNEGNLPQTNISTSFIPYDLKKAHNLPTDEDRQAIFAHHFYRLLHRAKNIYMTYNSGSEELGNAERSRFITQLENELDFTKGHTITHSTFNSNDQAAEISKIRYVSNDAVHKKLDEYLERGLSPSALNKLINCPMDFYYRYVLEMKENEQVEENIESSTFGTKIHDVLEQIFRVNFLDKNLPLDPKVLEKEKKNVEKYLREKYLNEFNPADIKYGQNKLSFEVSLQFILKFLDKQIAEIKNTPTPIQIIELEKKDFGVDYEWLINGVKKKIKISGKADRIDQLGSISRIVDYKSGKCEADKILLTKDHVKSGGMEALMHHTKKGYARQLLMYALMFRATYPEKKAFTAGIISMVNINDWLQNVRVGNDGDPILSDEILDAFERELKNKIEQLYSTDFYFEHDSKSQYCEHCEN